MAVAFSLLSAFLGGLVPVLIKRGAEELPATLVTCLKFSTAFAFLLVSVGIFHPEYFQEITLRALIIAVITALIGPVIAWAFYVKAMSSLDVTFVHPIVNSYPALSIILDLIFFKIKPKIPALLGFALIVTGITLIRTTHKRSKEIRALYFIFPFFTAILWGTTSFLFKIALLDINPILMSLLRSFFASLFLWIFNLTRLKTRSFNLPKFHLFKIGLAGLIGDVLGISLYFFAISKAPLYIVLPLTATSPFWSALMSKIFLKEKITLTRILGIAGVVSGVIFIVLSR